MIGAIARLAPPVAQPWPEQLLSLDLSMNQLGSTCAQALAVTLGKATAKLQSIELAGNALGAGDIYGSGDGLLHLARSVARRESTLTYLGLAMNAITGAGIEHFWSFGALERVRGAAKPQESGGEACESVLTCLGGVQGLDGALASF